jgi:acetyl-CoA carboxylase carboxyl transferase subunit alpha
MKLADKFNIPILTFIDCPGADASPDSENTGIFESIASCIECCIEMRVPIISTILGSGGSGGALAISSGNKVLMMSNSIYSVISPEGAAAILFRDSTKAATAAKAMKLTANEALKMGLVDEIINEDIVAHRNKERTVSSIRIALIKHLEEFKNFTREEIFAQRRKKFLNIGKQKTSAVFSQTNWIVNYNFFATIKKIVIYNPISLRKYC